LTNRFPAHTYLDRAIERHLALYPADRDCEFITVGWLPLSVDEIAAHAGATVQ
jgi:hypothetical protein